MGGVNFETQARGTCGRRAKNGAVVRRGAGWLKKKIIIIVSE